MDGSSLWQWAVGNYDIRGRKYPFQQWDISCWQFFTRICLRSPIAPDCLRKILGVKGNRGPGLAPSVGNIIELEFSLARETLWVLLGMREYICMYIYICTMMHYDWPPKSKHMYVKGKAFRILRRWQFYWQTSLTVLLMMNLNLKLWERTFSCSI